MTGDHDEGLGRLAEELAAALAAGEVIAAAAWAERFAVETADVETVLRALRALDTGLGEELDEGHPELPAPLLPADYELRGELGRGGMGVVYRAHQRSLDRDVAIKVLRPGDLMFGDAMRRFRAEAKNLARLRHRHIVSVHDLGESPDGTLWFAMDLIDGGTLADELQRHRRLLPSRAVRIVRQISAAIVHAHGLGIVHRDLKPQNVLIDRHGDAFVVDFGLARDASAAGARTLTGELLGTPAYMSPEQARGDSARIGEASDVWALGALLYELLTGRSPFAGKPLHETIRAILEDEPVSPRKLDARIPTELEAVCLQALRKRPEDRYATALAFAEDIERFADGRGVLAKPPSRWAGLGRALHRQRRTLLLVTAAIVATAAAAAFWLPSVRRAAVVAEAERLLDGGHPDAAVDSLRAQLATAGGAAERTEQLQLLLARAHNDRAAVHFRGGDLPAAKAAANEALVLTKNRVGGYGVVRTSELDRHRAWRWEWARAHALTEPDGRLPKAADEAVLQAHLG
jgi:predicted Ser/Thr protein kinase